ncbi:hypothetical protein TYRP_011588 [Tyrophagus putrescentiae]|nr:hypothetical protein TYRP_011588 [Tyrophagus putrescentiae]
MNIRELLKPKPADNRQQRIEAKLAQADPNLRGADEDVVTREEMLFLVEQKSRRIRVSSRPEKVSVNISEHLVSIECRAKRNRWRPTGYAVCRLCLDRQMPPAIFEAGAEAEEEEEEEGRAILRHLTQIHPSL